MEMHLACGALKKIACEEQEFQKQRWMHDKTKQSQEYRADDHEECATQQTTKEDQLPCGKRRQSGLRGWSYKEVRQGGEEPSNVPYTYMGECQCS